MIKDTFFQISLGFGACALLIIRLSLSLSIDKEGFPFKAYTLMIRLGICSVSKTTINSTRHGCEYNLV